MLTKPTRPYTIRVINTCAQPNTRAGRRDGDEMTERRTQEEGARELMRCWCGQLLTLNHERAGCRVEDDGELVCYNCSRPIGTTAGVRVARGWRHVTIEDCQPEHFTTTIDGYRYCYRTRENAAKQAGRDGEVEPCVCKRSQPCRLRICDRLVLTQGDNCWQASSSAMSAIPSRSRTATSAASAGARATPVTAIASSGRTAARSPYRSKT